MKIAGSKGASDRREWRHRGSSVARISEADAGIAPEPRISFADTGYAGMIFVPIGMPAIGIRRRSVQHPAWIETRNSNRDTTQFRR